jgi:DNA-binding CsgD family transcriptional regulator
MTTLSHSVEDALELIADSKAAAYGMDRHDRIVYWNEGASKALGWKADEVLGRVCFDVLAGRDLFGNRYCMKDCAIVRAAANGDTVEPFVMDVQRKGSGNAKIVVRTTALPAPGPAFVCLMHFIDTGEGKDLDRLVEAVRGTIRNDARPLPPDPPMSVSPLTPREREIVGLLSNGYAALNIAARLNLSHATVRNHIQNILRKLDVHSQVEAVALSFRRGWI